MTKARQWLLLTLVSMSLVISAEAVGAGIPTVAVRELSEFILGKFGRGAAGQTAAQLTEAIATAVGRHGDAVVPFLKSTGYAGFTVLERAGANAPQVIQLHARLGDKALSVITDPRRLSLFLKHGDAAADVLIKHPGIADDLVDRFGNGAVKALSSTSRQGAQYLGMAEKDGLLAASARSSELLPVVGKYGDPAMTFIWKHKGALAVSALLATFLANPEPYISGVSGLAALIANSVNWTFLVIGILLISFLPFIVRSVTRAVRVVEKERNR